MHIYFPILIPVPFHLEARLKSVMDRQMDLLENDNCYVHMLQDGYCHIDNVTLTANITGYVNVTSGDADALKVALLKHGPISVAIDASRKTFSFYSNGIYYDPECGKC